ncbi:MAG: phosphate/phosphite/phosphonate ABC transporter substrate-binding protein [Gammaproteobacteria bacterium]|nr:phosphate/phosphite/phosphonate ABC transporter substrate-binding protein [Gammaproteobacteria bacterium]
MLQICPIQYLGVAIRLSKKLLIAFYAGLIAGTSLTAFAQPDQSCKNASPIVFGILPLVSAEQLIIQFTPLAQYLSKHLHTEIRIETAPDFVEFARRTNEDKRYDILFTAPHFYPKAHSKAGYRLIAGVDSPGMRAVIVVPQQSKIHSIDDLRGKRLATVPPTGLATLLVRKYLSDAGIDPDADITLVSTPTHNASLLSSYHAVTDASALMQPPFEAASVQVRNNMRIIARTQRTPHIPISVNPRISESCAAEISELLLRMRATAEGREVLRHNNFSGFKITSTDDYKNIEDLLER